MKIDLQDAHSLYLLNFTEAERVGFAFVAGEVYRITAGKYKFPPLRSREIYVFRNPSDHPRYLSEPPVELISVNAEENKPLQFAYQLAHETSHLFAQNWRRFGQPGYYPWIEEALCGANSIFCIRQLSTHPGWWATHGALYQTGYIDQAYPIETIDKDWYETHKAHLAMATALTDTIKRLSRLIADEFPDGRFIADNIKLIDVPAMQSAREYLLEWKSRCEGSSSVPELLMKTLVL